MARFLRSITEYYSVYSERRSCATLRRLRSFHRRDLLSIGSHGESCDHVSRHGKLDVRAEVFGIERVTPARVERIPAVVFEVGDLPVAHLQRQSGRFETNHNRPIERAVVAARVARERYWRRRRTLHRIH